MMLKHLHLFSQYQLSVTSCPLQEISQGGKFFHRHSFLVIYCACSIEVSHGLSHMQNVEGCSKWSHEQVANSNAIDQSFFSGCKHFSDFGSNISIHFILINIYWNLWNKASCLFLLCFNNYSVCNRTATSSKFKVC